jgi:glycine hydroxymethyltransferase
MSTAHKTLRGPRSGFILTNDEELAKGIDKTVFPGMQGGPLMHVIAAKAVAFGEASQPGFKEYAHQVRVNAAAMASAFEARGVPVITGGTDNHLFLINVDALGISGRKAERILDEVGISTNRNTIPGEKRSAFQTSGLRIGTPAVTTRGFREDDVVAVADMIVRVLQNPDDAQILAGVRREVLELTANFGVPGLA